MNILGALRLLVVLPACLVAVGASLVLGGQAAHADSQRTGLSRDGVSWGTHLEQPLFDPDFRWVPGDVETKTFFVRNQSEDGGLLSLVVRGTAVEGLLRTHDLGVLARADGRSWQHLSGPGSHDLLAGASLASGEQSMVQVRVAFGAPSLNRSQSLPVDLDFEVGMEKDTRGLSAGTDSAPASTAGGLPSGAGGPYAWLAYVGAALLFTGTAIAAYSRRKEDHHDAA